MANSTTGFGFRPFGHRDGSAPTMGLERVFMNSSDTTAVYTGDCVARSSEIPGYVKLFGGSTLAPLVAGVFAGCEFYNPSAGKVTWSSYFPGNLSAVSSTNGPVTAYIVSDPEMQFLVRTSSIVGTSTVGTNYNISSAAGSATTGQSAQLLAAGSTTSGLSSYPFRVVDLYSNFGPPGVDGTDNTTAGNMVVVVPNNWDRKALTGLTS